MITVLIFSWRWHNLVKVYNSEGKEENFDRKQVENDLKSCGLSETLAKEVADKVEAKAEDGWTAEKIRQETSVELRRLQEEIDRAYISYRSADSMCDHNVGETRVTKESDYLADERPRKETMVECRNVEA